MVVVRVRKSLERSGTGQSQTGQLAARRADMSVGIADS